jgi:hypothetical protein
MAKQQTRYADFVAEWEQLTTSLASNTNEVPHLEAPRTKLLGLLEEVKSLAVQQDLHAANKQQVSKQLKARLADGKKLATFLRTGVKEHFGNRNEKVVEFGVQPFRRRSKAPVVNPPAPVSPVLPGSHQP